MSNWRSPSTSTQEARYPRQTAADASGAAAAPGCSNCDGGWLTEDEDRPAPCLKCRPHLRLVI